MNRYIKLSAALLAGMLVSGVAMAEEHKYFECKITRVYEPDNRSNDCGYDGAKKCDEKQERYEVTEFERTSNEYKMFLRNEGYKQTDRRINRANGEFSEIVILLNSRDSNPISRYGTCQLKTEKLKF